MAATQPLSICSLICTEILADKLAESLNEEHYKLSSYSHQADFLSYVQQQKQEIDCLVFESSIDLNSLTCFLHRQVILLPAIMLVPDTLTIPTPDPPALESGTACLYHQAEVRLPESALEQLPGQIETAMAEFLQLLKTSSLSLAPQYRIDRPSDTSPDTGRTSQQQGLSQKLKERLGHFGIFYKRDPRLFFRHMEALEQQEFLTELQIDYREIVLNYFNQAARTNQKIDALVAKAFFADLSVSQVLEIHMELMDTFAKQLKLEGRNEEILLDYRLTLIDVIAHLSEMYRRSLPREA